MILIFRMEAIKNGESTPIMDKIVFKKIRALLGGQMRLMLCGGAPLSKEVHDFMRVCIGAPLLQVSLQFNLYIFIKLNELSWMIMRISRKLCSLIGFVSSNKYVINHEFLRCVSSNCLLEKMICYKIHICNLFGPCELN